MNEVLVQFFNRTLFIIGWIPQQRPGWGVLENTLLIFTSAVFNTALRLGTIYFTIRVIATAAFQGSLF